MRSRSTVRAAWFCSALLAITSLAAQSVPPASARAATEGYPEQAYLSESRYANAYFGFSFELPPDAHLHAQAVPAARDGSVPLLELMGPAPADAEVAIAAIPTAGGKADDAKLLLRQALDQELYRGVEELRGLSKASFSGHQFYLFETRRGVEQHMLLATTMGEYIVRVVLAAHDEKVVKRLETSFEHVAFFPAADARHYVEADAKAYDGPSVSSHRLALLESDPPAKHIDAGNISGDFYENAQLGFSYRIPQGWSIESQGAVQSAIDQYRLKQDFGRPRMGPIERRMIKACSRTLFSVWAKRPGADGRISYDDFGEVTVSAISQACFPNMKFPQNTTDREAFKSFLGEFALTHPIVDDMREGKVFTEDGLTFLFLQGTVAFQVQDDELSRRLSLGLAITQRRGYLLTWFFAAPHDEELRALTNERASFDRGSSVTVARAPQAGGGVAADEDASARADSAKTAPETSAPASQPETTTPAATPASAPSTTPVNGSDSSAATTSAGGADQSAATQQPSSRPSLLRPGETMESQQGKGAVIKKNN